MDDQNLSQAIKARATYHIAPPAMRTRLRAALSAAPGAAVPSRRRTGFTLWGWFGGGAAAGFGAAVAFAAVVSFGLVAGVGPGWLQFPGHPGSSWSADLTDEIVASHVRSLMASHLSDVASTDQHTVKPWFNGKLDFSPPVADFAEQGYSLTGGRLDYLGRRPVAALVYRRHAHPINLFVWPESGIDANRMAASVQGYNLVQWRFSGMRFAAVSDLNTAELDDFVDLLRSHPAMH